MKLGFVIANDHEEFLADSVSTPGFDSRAWSPLPDLAKIYDTRNEALREARRIPYRAWVLELFETSTRYIVKATDKGPQWIR